MVERMFDAKIKCLQLDWGGEHRAFLSYLKTFGMNMHQQNGRAERKFRHVIEIRFGLLAQAHVPLLYWWEAFSLAICLINQLLSNVLISQSPYQLLFQKILDYQFLKVCCSTCFPFLRPYNGHKV